MNLSKFAQWKAEFEKHYFPKKRQYYPATNEAISEFKYFLPTKNPMKAHLVADLTMVDYDSYGNEDTELKEIYYFPDYDINIEFYGVRESHNGEYWHGFQEVKPTTKTITIYEPTNS